MKHNSCTRYVTGTILHSVSFPDGQVVCDLCDFCRVENAGTRFRCSITAEILPYHNKDTGLRCPLTFDTPEPGTQQNNEED